MATPLREGITLMKHRRLNSAFWALFTSNQALEGYHHHRALLSEVKGYIFFTGELGTYILFPPLALANQGSPNRSFYHILYSIFFHSFLVISFSFLPHSFIILALSTNFHTFPSHFFLLKPYCYYYMATQYLIPPVCHYISKCLISNQYTLGKTTFPH